MTKVSIGVPVFNGADRLDDALYGLRRQSHGDLEILISDNASTDATPEVIARHVAEDARIRAVRQTENIGPIPNFQAVAEAATGDAFLWRAHDDLCSEDFVARLLARAGDVDLVVPRTTRLRIGAPRKLQRPAAGAELGDAGARLRASAAGWFYGLWRREHACQTISRVLRDYPHVWAFDHLMIFPSILSGRIAAAEDAVFFHRLEQRRETERRPEGASRSAMVRDYQALCEAWIAEAGVDSPALSGALRRQIARRVAG